MCSSNIYKPSEQFVFSKNQSLNCRFHLQSQCHCCRFLLILLRPVIYHPSNFCYHNTKSLRSLINCLALLTKSTSFPFAYDFLFPFTEVGSSLYSYQNGFNPLVSSLRLPPLQGSTFVTLCSK